MEKSGNNRSSQRASRSQQKPSSSAKKIPTSKKRKQKSDSDNDEISVFQIPREEMISNGVHYCLIMQHSKVPIRRVDLIKIAFANQSGEYALVLKELEDVLEEVFGIRLIGVTDGLNVKKVSSNYILVSRFFKMTNLYKHKDADTVTRNALLFMILTVIFMTGHNIDEDAIWKIISEFELYPKSCSKREELRRFLKNVHFSFCLTEGIYQRLERVFGHPIFPVSEITEAYILPLYLTMEQVPDGTGEGVRCRYAWGFRADMEMSKYMILKYAAKQFPGKKPVDFANQFSIISNSRREKKLAAKDEQEGSYGMDGSQFNTKPGAVNDSQVEANDSSSSEEPEVIE